MPAGYEKIKADLLDQGLPMNEAKAHAAAIYNSQVKPGKPIVSPLGEGILKKSPGKKKGKK